MPLPSLPLEELKVALHLNVSLILFDYPYKKLKLVDAMGQTLDVYGDTQQHAINVQAGRFANSAGCRYLCSQTYSSCPHSVPAV